LTGREWGNEGISLKNPMIIILPLVILGANRISTLIYNKQSFIFNELLDFIGISSSAKVYNNTLHWTEIPLRSIAAGELDR